MIIDFNALYFQLRVRQNFDFTLSINSILLQNIPKSLNLKNHVLTKIFDIPSAQLLKFIYSEKATKHKGIL